MKNKPRRLSYSANGEVRPRVHLNIPLTSLLWPPGKTAPKPASSSWEHDLGLGELVAAFAPGARYNSFFWATLAALNTDADVIAWRQSVLGDFMRNPPLVEYVASLLPRFANLRQGNPLLGGRARPLLFEISDRLAELELYLDVVSELYNALDGAALESAALHDLRVHLLAMMQDENFHTLRTQLPELRAPLQNLASLTIGINLDSQMQPVAAVLLSVNSRPLTEPVSLLERLLGVRAEEGDESGIAPMHYVPKDPDERPLSPLFQDLNRLVGQVTGPIARSLDRYVRFSIATLTALEYELAFFASAVQLIHKLSARGVTFCQPEVAPPDERVTQIDGLMNIALAVRSPSAPVPSDVAFGDEGRIAILTGPNSGGKTTYLQSVGLAHVLFQAGLFVPARSARISPVDSILTHFPALETRQQGRLAEEATRLRELFLKVTPHSLVLLNETLSSTAFGEALYLAHDLLSALRYIGVRAVYATHLVELADRCDDIDTAIEGDSRLFSLVAGIRLTEDGQAAPTFEIRRGLPLGRSYAQEIARRHGIGLEQILDARREKERS